MQLTTLNYSAKEDMEAPKLRACSVLMWAIAICGCSGQVYQHSALYPDLMIVGRVESVESRSYFEWDTWEEIKVVSFRYSSFRYSDERDQLIRFVLPRVGVTGCATEDSEQLYVALLERRHGSEPELKEFRYDASACLPVDPTTANKMKSELKQ